MTRLCSSAPRLLALCQPLCTTLGKKLIVSLTGLAIAGFALTHMAGNMLLLVGAEAYNKYSYALVTNPLIEFAEVGLFALFVVHLGTALSLAYSNSSSRGKSPSRSTHGSKIANFGSRWMVLTGLVILAFLILHLATFKFGEEYEITYQGVVMRDIYKLVLEKFQDPLYVGFYEFSLLLLLVHLRHGVTACLQTLGIASSRFKAVKCLGWLVSIVIAGGFLIQPIYMMFYGGHP